MPIAKLLMLLN